MSWATMKSMGLKKFIIFSIVILISLFGICNIVITVKKAESFDANIRIDDTGTNTSMQYYASIAVDNQGIIHIVWADWRNDADEEYVIGGGIDGVNNVDIYYTNSTDSGITFGPNVKVNSGDGTSWQWVPDITVDNSGKIHVVWEDWRDDADGEYIPLTGGIDGVNDSSIYYARSLDGGQTFSSPLRIDDDSQLSVQGVPRIDIDNAENIHVIWIDVRDIPQGDIYYTNSTDGGITFNKNKKVNDVSKGSTDPSIAVDDNNIIYVVWVDERNDTTNPDIYFSKSMDGGLTFTPNKRINDEENASAYQTNPSIAANGGIVGLVWADDRNPRGIYFASSSDCGDNFGPNRKVDDDPMENGKSTPSVAIDDNGYVYVAWRDTRDDNEDIYFTNSTDGGGTFSTNQRINDDIGSSYQRFPSLALRNRTIFIVWQDDRNGNWDIYFSRSNFPPPMTLPISPLEGSIVIANTPTLEVTSVSDLDNDTVYYNFTISDQPDAESGTVYNSGWILSTSWETPALPNGKWYWHTYTSDMWNITSPNWVWNFTIDAPLQSFGIPIQEGWNLISIPLIQTSTDILEALNDSGGNTDWDIVQYYNIANPGYPWKTYVKSKPSQYNHLTNIDHTMGFWVHITDVGDGYLNVTGSIPTTTETHLKKGWNLVGYPSLQVRNAGNATGEAFESISGYVNMVQYYNASDSSDPWEEWCPGLYSQNDLIVVRPGYGLWIHVKGDCVWSVDW